jgi:UDP-N-acetyl-D-mannosaminuronate dehydrogenase
MNSNPTIAIVGLGYVGLPLAVEFGKRFHTIGFDLSVAKIAAYNEFRDPTGEVSTDSQRAAAKLECTTDPRRLASADFSLFRSKLRPMNPRIHNTKPSITEKKIANGSEQFVTAVPKSKIAPCK